LTKLPTFDTLLKAQTILLLAVRLFAGTEDKSLYVRIISIDLLEVVHVFTVFLLN
jgi:hypothetical protein